MQKMENMQMNTKKCKTICRICTQTNSIVISNKGRLPVSRLGAKHLEQHALAQSYLLSQERCSLSLSLAHSLPLTITSRSALFLLSCPSLTTHVNLTLSSLSPWFSLSELSLLA
jgi:hypothetical protein